MYMLTSFKYLFLFAVFGATFARIGVPSAMTTSSHNMSTALSKISTNDWQQLLKEDHSTRHKVAWKVKIIDVSYFGGFYVKGHILETNSAKVHLIWAPGATPSGPLRKNLVEGNVITILGVFEGVTAEKEAIIRVNSCIW